MPITYTKDGQRITVSNPTQDRVNDLLNEGYKPDAPPNTNLVNESTPKVTYNEDGTRTVNSGDARIDEYYNSLYQTPEQAQAKSEETKADFNNRLQDQISAIEEAYAPIYARAAEEAQGRLGSTATINAMSGQRGSPSGMANREKTVDYNTQAREAIDAKKSAEIAGIRDKYDQMLNNELKYQEQLRREDADKYIQYLSDKGNQESKIRQNRLDDIMATNVSFDQLDPDLQNEYADMYGYTIDEAKRSWDHKVAQQLLDKEQAEKQRQQSDEQYQWQKEQNQWAREDRANADVATENALRAQGYEYISDPKQLASIDLTKNTVVALKQPNGQPDKLYKVPKGMSELDLYEAKKAIDAKYDTSGAGSSAADKENKAFYSAVQKEVSNLQKGESWGNVWDRIKQQFPDKPDNEIDTALGMEWREPGAYEKWKAKQYKQNTPDEADPEAAVWAWLASDEAQNMSTAEKRKEIMANGFNPADFNIY